MKGVKAIRIEPGGGSSLQRGKDKREKKTGTHVTNDAIRGEGEEEKREEEEEEEKERKWVNNAIQARLLQETLLARTVSTLIR